MRNHLCVLVEEKRKQIQTGSAVQRCSESTPSWCSEAILSFLLKPGWRFSSRTPGPIPSVLLELERCAEVRFYLTPGRHDASPAP